MRAGVAPAAAIPVFVASQAGAYAMAWSEPPDFTGPLHLTLFDAGGVQTSDGVIVDGKAVAFIATATGYALAWATAAGVSLAEVDKTGHLVAAPVHISDDVIGDLSMLWDGSGIAMAWSEIPLKLYFMRVKA